MTVRRRSFFRSHFPCNIASRIISSHNQTQIHIIGSYNGLIVCEHTRIRADRNFGFILQQIKVAVREESIITIFIGNIGPCWRGCGINNGRTIVNGYSAVRIGNGNGIIECIDIRVISHSHKVHRCTLREDDPVLISIINHITERTSLFPNGHIRTVISNHKFKIRAFGITQFEPFSTFVVNINTSTATPYRVDDRIDQHHHE